MSVYSHSCASYITCGYHLGVMLILPCTLECVAIFISSNCLRIEPDQEYMVFTRCMRFTALLLVQKYMHFPPINIFVLSVVLNFDEDFALHAQILVKVN